MAHWVLLFVLLDLVGCAIEGTASLAVFWQRWVRTTHSLPYITYQGFVLFSFHLSSKEHCLLAIYFPWDRSRTSASSCYWTSWWHPKRQTYWRPYFWKQKKRQGELTEERSHCQGLTWLVVFKTNLMISNYCTCYHTWLSPHSGFGVVLRAFHFTL